MKISKLAEFRVLERHLAEQLLLGAYGKTLKDVIAILDPQARRSNAPATNGRYVVQSRKPQAVKVYKTPYTGEIIETKGGNHRQLKEWKTEHGAATVESWVS